RSVKSATCTSGEPVSSFLVANSFTTCCLRAALSDIGDLSVGREGLSGASQDVVQPGRAELAVAVTLLARWLALYTNSRGLRGRNSHADTSRYARSAGVVEIEHAHRAQLAFLDLTNGDQLALAGCIGRARRGRSIAAPDQHRLTTQQASGIVLADADRGKALQGRLDGKQQGVQRILALLCRGFEVGKPHRLRLVEGSNAGAAQRNEMAEALELAPHVASERAHVGALAAAGLEDGRVGVRHVAEVERIDLHQPRFQLDDLASARQVVGAVAVDLDGGAPTDAGRTCRLACGGGSGVGVSQDGDNRRCGVETQHLPNLLWVHPTPSPSPSSCRRRVFDTTGGEYGGASWDGGVQSFCKSRRTFSLASSRSMRSASSNVSSARKRTSGANFRLMACAISPRMNFLWLSSAASTGCRSLPPSGIT